MPASLASFAHLAISIGMNLQSCSEFIGDIMPMAARVLRSTDSRRTQELLHKLNS